jgi:hypothetical protein
MAAPRRNLDVAAIRRARLEQGGTLRQVAQQFGCAASTVAYHSRGVVLEGGHVIAGHGRSEISAGPVQKPTSTSL